MKNTRLVFIVLLSFIFSNIKAQTNLSSSFFDETDTFLNRYVTNGSVNYSAIKDEDGLASLISQVREMNLADASDLEEKAFYINAYNLSVIDKVLEDFPITTVLPNGNSEFFNTDKITVAGVEMTLDFLEKELLIKPENDARIHFAVNCAAISCPPIINKAYRPETLENQLNEQTRKALDDTDFTRVNAGNNEIVLSQIFNWFMNDFGQSNTEVLEYINEFRTQDIPTNYSISYYEYDWGLNEFEGEPNAIKALSLQESLIFVINRELVFTQSNGSFVIYDTQGKKQRQGTMEDRVSLEAMKGQFIVRMTTNNSVFTERIYLKP